LIAGAMSTASGFFCVTEYHSVTARHDRKVAHNPALNAC
jgi:hypothetical protein